MEDVEVKRFFKSSWEGIETDARALAGRLREINHPWKGMLAIARGGLVPAAIIAQELSIRVVETISVASYGGDAEVAKSRGDLRITKPAPMVGDGEGWLVVDDLADTGQTILGLRRLMPKAFFAALYAKPMGAPTVDLFMRELKQDTWILFPWELPESGIENL